MKRNDCVKSLCFAINVLSVYSHIQTRNPQISMPRNNKSYRNNKSTVKPSEDIFRIGLFKSNCPNRISLKILL